jgi:glycosyltransferase involved in cell wall biosynthesis
MKVLLVVSSICRAGGGVSEAVKQLAFELYAKEGISVEVITLLTPHFEEDSKSWPPIPIHACRQFGPRNFGFSPSMLRQILRIKPDIIHMHGIWMYHGFAVYLWHLISKKNYIITPHGMLEKWIIGRSPILKKLVSILFQKKLIKNSFSIQALTSKEVQDIHDSIPNPETIIIPNYVPQLKKPNKKPAWYKDEYSNKNIFLFLGRIHDKKGWNELLAAWRKINNEDKEFSKNSLLVFCGWLDNCPNFENEIDKLSNKYGNVVFAGPQHGSDKNATYYASNAFILPSKSEGLPMTILEAWQAGLIVLMTKECNLEIGFKYKAAIAITSNVDGIKLGLEKYIELSDFEKKTIINNGTDLIQKHFSSNVITKKFIDLYKKANKT